MKNTIITTIISSVIVGLIICGFWYAVSKFETLQNQVVTQGQEIASIANYLNNATKAQTK